MRTIDAVLFDKTGTLTKGQHVVTGVVGVDRPDDEIARGSPAAVESDSEHPLARAIVAAASTTRQLVGATELPRR